MFTGIIQAIGKAREPESTGEGIRMTIVAPTLGLDTVAIGDSIAVQGVCLTVISKTDTEFQVDVSAETLSKTAGLNDFGEVNLEKALRVGDRLDGHIVSGHVDGVGIVETMEPVAECYHLVIRAPRLLSKYLAYKGSVTVNGVSLTINQVEDTAMDTLIHINLIPHTVAVTTLKNLKQFTPVNLEVDTIARYVERMLSLEKNDDEFF